MDGIRRKTQCIIIGSQMYNHMLKHGPHYSLADDLRVRIDWVVRVGTDHVLRFPLRGFITDKGGRGWKKWVGGEGYRK